MVVVFIYHFYSYYDYFYIEISLTYSIQMTMIKSCHFLLLNRCIILNVFLQKNLSFKKHISNQFRRHKWLIISPIGLIILSLLRIILVFQLKSMKFTRDSVILHFVEYFISFLSLLLLFIVFVLSSRIYRKPFKETLTAGWKSFYC